MKRTLLTTPQLFNLRARIWGSVHWICPYTGHLNQSRVNPESYRLICAPGHCNRRFIPGIVLYSLPPGKQRIPPDWVIPVPGAVYNDGKGLSESMPMGDLAIVPWRVHRPTHILLDPGSSDFDVRSMVRMVRNHAETARHGDLSFGSGNGTQKSIGALARLGAAFLEIADGYGY